MLLISTCNVVQSTSDEDADSCSHRRSSPPPLPTSPPPPPPPARLHLPFSVPETNLTSLPSPPLPPKFNLRSSLPDTILPGQPSPPFELPKVLATFKPFYKENSFNSSKAASPSAKKTSPSLVSASPSQQKAAPQLSTPDDSLKMEPLLSQNPVSPAPLEVAPASDLSSNDFFEIEPITGETEDSFGTFGLTYSFVDDILSSIGFKLTGVLRIFL